jgi:succinyl-CoA:acetate CoA-transferase
MDAAIAARTIDPGATVVVSGFGSVGYPKAVPSALARDWGEAPGLTLVSGGSVGPEIDSAMVDAGALAHRAPYQAQPTSRAAIDAGELGFDDRHVSAIGEDVYRGHYGSVDVAIVEAVAVGPDWLVPSTALGPTPSYVAAADRLIVELNVAQPLALGQLHDVYRRPLPPARGPIPLVDPGERIGGPRIGFDAGKLRAVVDTSTPDTPYSFREPTATDQAIAGHLATLLETELGRNPALDERVALQFGVGSLGNALMGALETVPFGSRELVYYGEVIQDGLLDLLDSGRLDTASAASLALSTAGQERLFADIERYAEAVVLRPAAISNSPALIRQFGVIAVNSALEVDLYGHVNSTHLAGSRLVNGIGGSGDFLRNAPLSIVTLGATADDGAISRIVPMAAHVDHTEHDVDIVITEQGVADLRGLTPSARAETLLGNCAHPAFEPALRDYLAAADAGHEPHDRSRALDWQD